MVITGNLVAQWVSILLGFIYFIHKQDKASEKQQDEQAKSDGERLANQENIIEKVDMLQKSFERFKETATGPNGYITTPEHDKMQSACQKQLRTEISNNAITFDRVSKRLDKMDENREKARDNFDARMNRIEINMASMAGSIEHISIAMSNSEQGAAKSD